MNVFGQESIADELYHVSLDALLQQIGGNGDRQRRKGSLRDYDAETGWLAARGNCSVLLLRPRPPVENGRPPLSLPALDRDPDSVPFAEATSLPNVELGHHGAQLFGRAEAPPPIL